MREFRLRTALITAIIMTVMSASFLTAQHRANISLGGGMHVPLGDLGDENLLRGKAGPSMYLGFDYFIMKSLSLGLFFSADFYKPKDGIVYFSDQEIRSDGVNVGQYGIAARYFFNIDARLRPYGKAWFGGAWLNIESTTGFSGGPSGGAAWGIGAGIQYEFIRHIGINCELLYNFYNDDNLNMPRVGLGMTLSFLM